MAVPSAALTEVRIAGLLEALKEVPVGVPAVATGVAAFPGAQLLSLRTLSMLAVASVTPAPTTKVSRGVAALAARRIVLAPLDIPFSGVNSAPIAARTEALACLFHAAVSTVIIGGALLLLLDRCGHRFPAACLTQLAEQALVSVIDATPLVTFEPGLQRYFLVKRSLVGCLNHHRFDRASSISGFGNFGQELLSKGNVARLQRLITVAL